jgi:hypothetical protein
VGFRLLAIACMAALVAVGIATGATTAVPKLHGTIGPGYTISLKNAQGKKVKSLKRGKYTFIVRDKANIHNFTGFVGTKTVSVTLKKGTYRFYCTVHPFVSGTFKVT